MEQKEELSIIHNLVLLDIDSEDFVDDNVGAYIV